MVLYQLFVRYFGNKQLDPVKGGTLEQNGCGTFADIDEAALDYLQALGIEALWLTGVIDHATLTTFPQIGREADHPAVVKGEAGSPYAIRDYFGLAPSLARSLPEIDREFDELLDRAHVRGLKVIIDFVPNHTARRYRPAPGHPDPAAHDDPSRPHDPGNFYFYLGEPLTLPDQTHPVQPFVENPAKATGNDVFSARPSLYDWYETAKINHGPHPHTHSVPTWQGYSPVSWAFLLSVLEHWAGRGVDGFRCDMVDMLPNAFWVWAIARLRKAHPDLVIIGESYVPDRYGALLGAGFTYLYDKVGVYDGLMDWVKGEDHGRFGEAAWTLRHLDGQLLRFTENHDEPRRLALHISPSTDCRALAAFALTAALADGALMIYNGQDLGEYGVDEEGFSGRDGKSTIFDYWPVPSLSDLARASFDPVHITPRAQIHHRVYTRLIRWARETRGGLRYHLDMADAEYWLAQGTPPSTEVLSPKALIKQAPGSGQLYLLVATGQLGTHEGKVFIPINALTHFGKAGGRALEPDSLSPYAFGSIVATKALPEKEGYLIRYQSTEGLMLAPFALKEGA